MNSFSYTNPYSSRKHLSRPSPSTTPSSPLNDGDGAATPANEVDSLITRLEQTSPSEFSATVQQLWKTLESQSSKAFEWNGATVQRWTEWAVPPLRSGRSHHETTQHTLLLIWIHLLQQWEDELGYAALLHQEDDLAPSLLSVFQDISSSPNTEQTLQASALTGLILAWNTFDRLQFFHSQGGGIDVSWNGDAWWLTDWTGWQAMIPKVVSYLMMERHDEGSLDGQLEVAGEGFRITCMSFLAHLLENHQSTFIQHHLTESVLGDWSPRLVQEAARWADPNMPWTAYTQMSLQSYQLILSLQHQGFMGVSAAAENLVHASLIDQLVDCIMSSGDEGACGIPRWARLDNRGQSISCHKSIRNVFYSLMRAVPSMVVQALATRRCVQTVARSGWTALHSSTASPPSNQSLWQLWIISTFSRRAARSVLDELVGSNSLSQEGHIDSCRNLVGKLFRLTRRSGSVEAAVLLREMLKDRSTILKHDHFSRMLWQAVDSRMLSQCLEMVVTFSHKVSGECHSNKLLCILDICDLALKLDPSLCQSMMSTLTAQQVEGLIDVMSPKDIRMDCSKANIRPIESEDSTPPLHNLSRLEEDRSILIEDSPADRGMDPSIRFAAATVLAVLSRCATEEVSNPGSVTLLQGRMNDGVASFVSDYALALEAGNSCPSLKMTRRRLRLLSAHVTPESEDHVSHMLHTIAVAQHQEKAERAQRLDRLTQDLVASQKREAEWRAQAEDCNRRLAIQSVSFQRAKCETQRLSSQTSKELVRVHQAERDKAERSLQEVSRRLLEAEHRMTKTEVELKESRASEMQCKGAYDRAAARLSELELADEDHRSKLMASQEACQKLAHDLHSAQSSLSALELKSEEMHSLIRTQEETCTAMEEREIGLRDSLEALFGDMVSLAHLYEIKESEVSEHRENGGAMVEKLKRKLQEQEKAQAALQARLDHAESENDHLSRKYSKVREKLQEEREKDRRKERQLRAGKMSYMNQLNMSTTTASEKSSFRGAYSSREDDKENSQARFRSRKDSQPKRSFPSS